MQPLSYFFGWAYAIVWGLAFYPTIYLSYKIKSSDSISPDYIILNTLGYISYTVSIALQLFSTAVIAQFLEKFGDYDKLPHLSIIDLFYSIHGTLLNLIVLVQVYYGEKLLGYHVKKTIKLSRMTKIIYVSFFLYFFLSILSPQYQEFPLVSTTLNLSYFKMFISFIKYLPQVVHNARRKSMYGISKLQILLDLTGCTFAFLQLTVDNPTKSLLEMIYYNRSKAGLILITMIFDCIYILQFFLYKENNTETDRANVMEKV